MEYARVTQDIAQPAERVWAEVKEFGGIRSWVAGVSDCRLERQDGAGAVRVVTLGGREVREQLVEIDDAGRRLTYAVLPPHSLPASEVISTILVEAIDAAHARVTWFSEAELDAPNPALTDRITAFFAASLANLDRVCSGRGA